MKHSLILIQLACTLYLGCKRKEKEEPLALPEVSTVGANTFGCKVNGALFFNDAPPGDRFFRFIAKAFNDTCALTSGNDKALLLTFLSKNGKSITFYLDDLQLGTNIIRPLNRFTPPWPARECALDYGRYVAADGKAYQTDENHTGQIKLLNFDYLRGYVAGTFSFKGVHPPTGETVEVTEGRFDINLNIYR
jgi:hypothetical protein